MIEKVLKKRVFRIFKKREKLNLKVYHEINGFRFPNNVHLHSYVLLGKLENYVEHEKTVVQRDSKRNEIVSWDSLSRNNPRLLKIQNEINVYEGQHFPPEDWDNAAKVFVKALKQQHLLHKYSQIV